MELKNMKSDRMKVLQMDVCSDQEVAQAVDFVKRTLKEPEEGMWGLCISSTAGSLALCSQNPSYRAGHALARSFPLCTAKRELTSLEACDSVWLAVRLCCTWVSEENCLAVDVLATWKETKTGWRIRL